MKHTLLVALLLLGTLATTSVKADFWTDLKAKWAEAQEKAREMYEERQKQQAPVAGKPAQEKSWFERLADQAKEAYEKAQQQQPGQPTKQTAKSSGSWLERLQDAYEKLKEDEQAKATARRAKEELQKRSPSWFERLQDAFGATQPEK